MQFATKKKDWTPITDEQFKSFQRREKHKDQSALVKIKLEHLLGIN